MAKVKPKGVKALNEELHHPAQTWACFGQGKLELKFEKAFQSKKLSHSFLLLGPEGIGKRTFAYRMIRLLASGAPSFQGLDALDSRLPVFQKIGSGTHDDLWVLEPETRGKSPPVEAVRSLHTFVHHTSINGKWRLVLMDGIDWMSRSASNALLKAVEEPAPGVVFFLLSERIGGVLPTLRSRCQLLKLAPLTQAQMTAHLKGAFPLLSQEALEAVLRLSKGCLGKAMSLIKEERWKSVRHMMHVLDKGSLPFTHPDFRPLIQPEVLAHLGEQEFSFWEPFLFDWLHQRTLDAIEKGQELPPSSDVLRQTLTQGLKFNLDTRHLWARLFSLLTPQAAKTSQAA